MSITLCPHKIIHELDMFSSAALLRQEKSHVIPITSILCGACCLSLFCIKSGAASGIVTLFNIILNYNFVSKLVHMREFYIFLVICRWFFCGLFDLSRIPSFTLKMMSCVNPMGST